ncbi:hypothetical protein GCM10010124_10700 [Pilimelia terevasa]|uniref:Nitroreductase domain-containing protein n=1 Tax=Pilimelia terevasa TaxID=53372 RepID=A0A8J3BLM1_9ACTN|nr:hypothetical protein GCM10010124_10700 [Pilimelia terevasa]
MRRRRMVRNYDPDRPVSAATVDALLDLARRAPSAGFTQGWGFLVLTEAADRARFWAAASPADPDPARANWREGLRRAPVVVVPFASASAYLDRYAEPDKGWTDRDPARWPVPYWHVDAGFAALLLLLGAVDAGLGACFFGVPGPRVPALRAAFGVPEEFAPVGALTVGYPAPDRRSPSLRRGRRPRDEVVHHGRWCREHDTSASGTSAAETESLRANPAAVTDRFFPTDG